MWSNHKVMLEIELKYFKQLSKLLLVTLQSSSRSSVAQATVSADGCLSNSALKLVPLVQVLSRTISKPRLTLAFTVKSWLNKSCPVLWFDEAAKVLASVQRLLREKLEHGQRNQKIGWKKN